MAFHWSAITLYCLHCDMVSQVDRIVIERVVRDSVATLVTEIMELVLGVFCVHMYEMSTSYMIVTVLTYILCQGK